MGEVGVHLDDELCSAGQGPGESGQVGLAEAGLAGPVKDLDGRELGRQPVGDLPGPVRGVVIHDQQPVRAGRGLLELSERSADDRLEVLGLVIGGDDEPVVVGHRVAA